MKQQTRQQQALPVASKAVLALIFAGLIAGCGGSDAKPPSQTAAKVNKEEITVHQINAVLARQRAGAGGDSADSVARRVLERLIDQELAVQKAAELKIDRDPRVLQAIAGARREIIARAYAERLGEGAPKPSPEEIRKYYDNNPALFRERRVYQLQEIAIQAEPGKMEALRAALQASKTVADFIAYLKANGFKFSGSQAVRAAEQVPLNVLPTLAAMKDGQKMLHPTSTGATALVLVSSRPQPVDEERAARAIEQYLHNDYKRKMLSDDMKALRAASRIEYVGKYQSSEPVLEPASVTSPAEVAASAAATPESKAGAGVPNEKPSPEPSRDSQASIAAPNAASAADSSAIAKGLGLK